MQNDEFFFPQAIYLTRLKIIDGIPLANENVLLIKGINEKTVAI